MPLVTYTGPHDGVDLAGVGTVARGESIDVPREVAKNLAGRDDFEVVTTEKPRKSAGTATTKKEG